MLAMSCQSGGMNTIFHPNDNYLQVSWSELETAWRMLASPEKLGRIEETLNAVRTLNRNAGPERAVFTMVAATAWLTDDGTGSDEGWTD